MKDSSHASSRITSLRDLGVHIAIEDFGIGYSSLSGLQRIPVDSLKIDRSFIQGIESSKNGPRLIQSIVGLARSLQMKATAEGVESIAQLSALQSAGCDSVQGFLFGKALPFDDVQRLVVRFPRIAVPRFLAVMPQAKNPAWKATARMRPLASDVLLSTGALEASLTVAL
jgi:EAL domain-containing protein (putative c-di-GMP-specific phosphodiesterase class I)